MRGLVDRLVESGHISRATSPNDRRVQIIALTDFGRDWFRKAASRHGDWLSGLFADMSAKDRETLMTMLGRLKSSVLRELDPGA